MNIRELFHSFDHSGIPELSDPQYCRSTFCPDTPDNWFRFEKLKYLIVSGVLTQANAPSERQLKQARKDLAGLRKSCYERDQS